MTAMTPMRKLVRRGNDIFTVDYVGNERLVCTCPENATEWVFNSLAMYHKVSTEEYDINAND